MLPISELDLPELPQEDQADEKNPKEQLSKDRLSKLIETIKNALEDRVSDVRVTDRLTNSVARLVDTKGSLGQEVQRVYKMMDKDYQIPKKILEINANHPIIINIADLPEDSELGYTIIEQIFESALLIEGLHPDPASMIPRIQTIMESALKSK